MQVSRKSHYILVTVKAAVSIAVRTYYFLPGLSTSHLSFLLFIFNSSAPSATTDGEMLMRVCIAECLCFWKMQLETAHKWIHEWNENFFFFFIVQKNIGFFSLSKSASLLSVSHNTITPLLLAGLLYMLLAHRFSLSWCHIYVFLKYAAPCINFKIHW